MVSNYEQAIAFAITIAKVFEGCILHPYLCPAGVPTIGYGSTHYEDGTRVTLLDPPITKERATKLLYHEMVTNYGMATAKLCPTLVTVEGLGAICDFCYNVGKSALSASTLRKRILAQEWDQVPEQLMRWTKGGGRELKGLVLRRKAEAASFEV